MSDLATRCEDRANVEEAYSDANPYVVELLREAASELSRLQRRNAELERGIADERDACAKVVEGAGCTSDQWAKCSCGAYEAALCPKLSTDAIAQAIRSRLSQPEKTG